jgi:hypothetical protein
MTKLRHWYTAPQSRAHSDRSDKCHFRLAVLLISPGVYASEYTPQVCVLCLMINFLSFLSFSFIFHSLISGFTALC